MKKPEWCPHKDCKSIIYSQNLLCTGILHKLIQHDNDFNTHCFCLNEVETGHGIHDLLLNKTDAWYIKRHMDMILNQSKLEPQIDK